jgi:hypothetical protein
LASEYLKCMNIISYTFVLGDCMQNEIFKSCTCTRMFSIQIMYMYPYV